MELNENELNVVKVYNKHFHTFKYVFYTILNL